MFTTTQAFFEASRDLILHFNLWAKNLQLPAQADHLCYKCADATEFEHIRQLFAHEADFIYQSIISKRRIAVIKFKTAIETELGKISILGLSPIPSEFLIHSATFHDII